MFFRKRKFAEFTKPKDKTIMRKYVNILVVDDDPDSFPINSLAKEGFNIQRWSKVEPSELDKLETGTFDIIILDIVGVAEDISNQDGIGVLETIKNNNPAQVIIAFSGQSFDFSKSRFFKLADDMLPKPVDLITCRNLLDELIENKINIGHYWNSIKSILENSGVTPKKIAKLEHSLASSRSKDVSIDLNSLFSKILKGGDMVEKCVTLAYKILTLVHSQQNV